VKRRWGERRIVVNASRQVLRKVAHATPLHLIGRVQEAGQKKCDSLIFHDVLTGRNWGMGKGLHEPHGNAPTRKEVDRVLRKKKRRGAGRKRRQNKRIQ